MGTRRDGTRDSRTKKRAMATLIAAAQPEAQKEEVTDRRAAAVGPVRMPSDMTAIT